MRLYPHQQEALKQTADRSRCAYFLDMGLGKTHTGSEKMLELGARVNLVVCQKSKVDDWVNHFEENYYYAIRDLTNKKDFETFMFEAVRTDLTCPVIAIINYDLIWRRKYLKQLSNFTLILDESSLIQHDNTKRTKFIMGLNPSNVILLSGTPVSGKYENLYTQIQLLGWNISRDTFDKQYINWTLTRDDGSGIRHKIVDKENPYKNVERLKDKLRQHGAVFMKTEEVFDLPEQNFIKQFIPTTKEYWKFKRDCIITMDTLNLKEFKDDSDFYGTDVTPKVELVGDCTLSKSLYQRI